MKKKKNATCPIMVAFMHERKSVTIMAPALWDTKYTGVYILNNFSENRNKVVKLYHVIC